MTYVLLDAIPDGPAFTVPVNSRREVRVYLADHNGVASVHVREFKKDWRRGAMAGTHSGAAVPVERLGELIEALQRLKAGEGESARQPCQGVCS